MPDSLDSPTIRSGNVLALLNTLYTSGFAMASPSTPVLKGRTMHTLYAISFIVYVSNCVADWVHVWATLQGHVTSFPVETWLAVALVSTAVSGSMITWLLLVLCMENAFAHRLDVTPYRSGFVLILEAVVDWIQAFNNFRVAFLVMILHDAPMSLINFFIIAPCRCAGPTVTPWTLLVSSVTSVISVCWRITMLYFAYRRMLCPLRKTSNSVTVHRMPTPSEHLETAIDIRHGGRLNEFDECWPVRWARMTIYGKRPKEEENGHPKKSGCICLCPLRPSDMPSLLTLPCLSQCASGILQFVRSVRDVIYLIVCVSLSLLGYMAMCLTLCIPYCYHYTCRRNSFYHRHKCARSFVRYCSYMFHYCIFVFSVLLSASLLSLNFFLISSVHVIGSNRLPPEIDTVCVTTQPVLRSVVVDILPGTLSTALTTQQIVNRIYAPMDNSSVTVCKPIWEDGGLGLGLKRAVAGPWQTRTVLHGKLLALATQVTLNNTNMEDSYLELKYDIALITRDSTEGECVRGNSSGWTFHASTRQLPLPYFLGCRRVWRFSPSELIECVRGRPPTTAAPRQGWTLRRRNHKTRHRHLP